MAANNISDADRKKLFGDPKWTRLSGDNVDLDNAWEKANIVPVYVPQLKGISTGGGRCSGHIMWNVHCVEQLLRAFADIANSGFLSDILTYDGSFVARVKRNGNTLSNHAYGTAIDLNAQWNWLGETPAKVGQKGYLGRIVPIFKTHGFGWGGDWTSPKDGMHFEVLRIVNYDMPDEAEQDHPELPKGPLLVLDDRWKEAVPLTIISGSSMVSGKALFAYAGEKWEGADKQVNAVQNLGSLGYWWKWDNQVKKLFAYKRK